MGPAHAGEDAPASRARRRRQRRRVGRAAAQDHHRPRYRLADGDLPAGRRRHALRRVRAAAGHYHLHPVEPVPGDPGAGAGGGAAPRSARPALRAHPDRRAGAVLGGRASVGDARSAGHQPPGPVPRGDHLLKPGEGRRAGRSGGRDQRAPGGAGPAARRALRFRRHRPGLPGVARQRARADRGRAPHRLHRAGRALRELHPPGHHPLDAALRGGGGSARVDGLPDGIQRHPAHRHREEERHHDDRLRARGRARPGPLARRGHHPGLPVAIPADHDDHDGRAPGRPAAGAGPGDRFRAAPSARHQHRGRPARLAGAHALHHSRHLPLHGPPGTPAARADEGGTPAAALAMNVSAPFIQRPVATSLLAAAILLAGAAAYTQLPVAPLPRVDFPTISVNAALPGASPETMASTVAAPLERRFGRIAGLREVTSISYLGSTSITLQFELDRDVDAAARDVQAAINAAGGDLPANLPTRPNYRKVNPADAPILILSLTSATIPLGQVFDQANTVLAQKISQVPGVGQVFVGGGQQPAVRVQADPQALAGLSLSLEDVRAALANSTVDQPKGAVSGSSQMRTLAANDQLLKAKDFAPLVIAYRNGAPVRLSDVARVIDSVENERVAAWADTQRAVLIIIRRQPGANIIDVIERVEALLPQLSGSISPAIDVQVSQDRSQTIRASVADVQFTLVISVCLVVLVVFAFLRSIRATVVPSVAVPLSLVGTFGAMYLLSYSLDNLSLMALTIATGFVVDDAIVVTENIARYVEQGMPVRQAALTGAKQIGFTIISITCSLLAVFIPLLLMGGIVGRLFREFAVTLSVAITISMVVSLTTTPMMCAHLLRVE